MDEPSEEESIAILKGLRSRYEEHHRVEITDDALEAAVKLFSRYINDRFLPDKAIDLIDEAASKYACQIIQSRPRSRITRHRSMIWKKKKSLRSVMRPMKRQEILRKTGKTERKDPLDSGKMGKRERNQKTGSR